MEGVWDGIIHLGKVHSILKILHIQVGLIIDYVFDYVEIDSSFYRVPNVFMVNNWNTKTQEFQIHSKISKGHTISSEITISVWRRVSSLDYNPRQ